MQEALTVAEVMGPMVGGLMVHVWIDLAVFILALYCAVRLGKAKLIQPFVLMIGLGALAGFLLMVARQPMWIASTIRSILFFVAISWLVFMLRPVKVPSSQESDSKETTQ
ncbi:hypothetical protein A3F45_00465 [Candidatus Curtissbacteria bacterium RIFCSPHIGHO2_12_FULL_41_17]|uniref:Uncharacterized protein n=1 Tax=Candidatus Curtissbacteria bacterium RIFCSPHIGHO2_12_FULL_41_17 TaxID=1797722 RepID=A0A1F5HKU5_9BACT|nr:MAG: hypothetical protein A3F45_00465 [Candidatus Curtissbacteria bacterium RIFCSPHIGHO2_12_FULL_41_17]